MLGQRSTADGFRPPPAEALVHTLLACVWALAARALTTSVQMIWTYVSAATISDGLLDDQRGTNLHLRILLIWALFLTLAGSAATVHMLRWRERLGSWEADAERDDKSDYKRGAQDEQRGIHGSHRGCGDASTAADEAHNDEDPPEASGPPPLSQGGGARPLPRSDRRPHFDRRPSIEKSTPQLFGGAWEDTDSDDAKHLCQRLWVWLLAAAIRVLLLCERVLSYVTAWAWTDVFFASASRPSLWGVLRDSGVALGLSVAVIAWLVLVGGALELQAGTDIERSVVESYFVANSASFFVGFAWWKVVRDVAALSGRAAVIETAGVGFSSSSATEVEQYGQREFAGALASNFLFGPVLTVVVIWAKHAYLVHFLETTASADAEAIPTDGTAASPGTCNINAEQTRRATRRRLGKKMSSAHLV